MVGLDNVCAFNNPWPGPSSIKSITDKLPQEHNRSSITSPNGYGCASLIAYEDFEDEREMHNSRGTYFRTGFGRGRNMYGHEEVICGDGGGDGSGCGTFDCDGRGCGYACGAGND